jgi:hypothetical protein
MIKLVVFKNRVTRLFQAIMMASSNKRRSSPWVGCEHRYPARQTAAGAIARFRLPPAGRLLLYFTVGRLRAHGENVAVSFVVCTRHRTFAVACVAVWCSPWANARRQCCHVFAPFCRAPQAHGIARFSGSESNVELEKDHGEAQAMMCESTT